MAKLKDEKLPPCRCCGKVWKRHETDKYVYHKSIGVVCLHHHGVKEWYNASMRVSE